VGWRSFFILFSHFENGVVGSVSYDGLHRRVLRTIRQWQPVKDRQGMRFGKNWKSDSAFGHFFQKQRSLRSREIRHWRELWVDPSAVLCMLAA
jgi:hypothetical protein